MKTPRFAVVLAVVCLGAGCKHSEPPSGLTLRATPTPAGETSAQAVLAQDEVRLPPRSQVIQSLDLVAGCGMAPATGRIQLDGRAADWKGTPTEIPGTFRHDAGEFIWSEFPFDDAGDGAFQYPGEGTPISAQEGTAGTANELMQRYGANTADIVEFRATADATHLYLLVRSNFLNAVDSTVVGLGFDLDRSAATGFSAWPRGANIATPDRGLDLFITAFGSCAYLTTADGEQGLDQAGGAIRVGTRDNVFEIALPLSALKGSQGFDLVGGSGLWDAAAQTWMPVAMSGSGANNNPTPRGKNTAGAPEVFNLMFRDDEASINACAGVVNADTNCMPASFRSFQARNQVMRLRAGSSGPYAARIEVARLQPDAVGDPQVLRRGTETFFTRVYRSRVDAEGILLSGNNAVFTSRYQPYTLYVPSCFEAGCAQWPDKTRAPLGVQLHGGGNDHLSAAPRPSLPEGGNALYGSEDFFAAYDREAGALLASPLGRGLQLPSWRGYGEVDVLEVLDVVRRAYGSDPHRQGIIGGSQGGFGTFRMAGFYPDLWNSVSVECPVANEASSSSPQGHVVPSTVPFVVDVLIPSLINLPYLQGSGTLDPLAPITMNQRLRDAALAAGLDVKYTEYLAGSHCFDIAQGAYPYTNADAAAAARALRVPRLSQPARVRYRIDPRQYPPAAFNGLADIRDIGVSYAGAHWISGLRLRAEAEQMGVSRTAPGGADESALGDILAVSHALPGWQVSLEDCVEGLPVGIAGLVGGNPQSEPLLFSPNAYQCQRQNRGGDLSSVLELDVKNLDAGAVDLAAAGLAGGRFMLRARGDGAFELRLIGEPPTKATGGCVRGFEGAVLKLELGSEICEITLEN